MRRITLLTSQFPVMSDITSWLATSGGSFMRSASVRNLLFAVIVGLIGLAASPAQAQNRFWLVNNTGTTIREVYVSSSRVSHWGPDILGANVLPAGNRIWVVPSFGDCVLDIRVVYMTGQAVQRMGVNACSLSVITVGGGGGYYDQRPPAGAGALIR